MWTDWSQWSDCTVTCGKGSRQRARTCQSLTSKVDNPKCEGMSLEMKVCFTARCETGKRSLKTEVGNVARKCLLAFLIF